MLKFSGVLIWRLGSRGTLRKYSNSSTVVMKINDYGGTRSLTTKPASDDRESDKNAGLVAAAFASLSNPDAVVEKKPTYKSAKISRFQKLDNQIQTATDIDGLLRVAENPVVSRKHALKMVSTLSEWTSSNKVKISDFEKDPRFLKLCRILARTPTSQAMSSITMADDLSTVLGITGDDEAARLIANLTLHQLIKVLKALHQKGRRSTPLLRALSNNIVKQTEPIDLKKSADILYSMAALNFPDPVLLDRICSDVINQLSSNEDKSAVVNSIVVSLGMLKYRHEGCLQSVASWLQEHRQCCRSGDLASAVVTLATLNYVPPGCDALLETVSSLKEEELSKPSAWLDLVFSLLILGRASEQQLASTLKHEFIDKLLTTGEIPIPARRKLMAIDGHVSLAFPNYSGPRLPEDIAVGVPIVYTKEKNLYVQSVMDTFKNMVSSENFMKRDCNSEMGFLYDCEFAVDAKCHPVSLEKAANNKSVYRIAVLSLDYHDMCRKTAAPLGIYQLYSKLLELKGYNVLQIPFTEFNPKDKLVARVQYIQKRLAELVAENART